MNDTERCHQLRQLWLARPEGRRTGHDVFLFYGWLARNEPQLLKRGHGDPYQHLKSDLSGHVRETLH